MFVIVLYLFVCACYWVFALVANDILGGAIPPETINDDDGAGKPVV